MSKIRKFCNKLINHPNEIPKLIFLNSAKNNLLNWLPDTIFLKLYYRAKVGKRLDLKQPKSFNEKLQWLKLYDRNPLYTKLVDKYEVRSYIKNKIGNEYLVPLIGVWDKSSEIDFSKLPEQFVLKCTHDSGSTIICKDKKEFDFEKAKKILDSKLKRNLYWHGREWPYKYATPRIVCEKLLSEDIFDYKFYCFNGIPKFLYVAQGDNTIGTLKMNFYDMNWEISKFFREDHEQLEQNHKKPENFEDMVKISKELSKGFQFVRVDLFNVSGKLYFGELTFTPGAGFTPFTPAVFEKEIGKWIELPTVKTK